MEEGCNLQVQQHHQGVIMENMDEATRDRALEKKREYMRKWREQQDQEELKRKNREYAREFKRRHNATPVCREKQREYKRRWKEKQNPEILREKNRQYSRNFKRKQKELKSLLDNLGPVPSQAEHHHNNTDIQQVSADALIDEVLKLEEKDETTSEAEQTGGDVFLPYANAFAASVASAAVVADEQQQRAAMQQVAASLREKMRASCRKWREKNRQRCSEYFRQYREKRKASQAAAAEGVSGGAEVTKRSPTDEEREKLREMRRKWREKNRDKCREYVRNYRVKCKQLESQELSQELKEKNRRWQRQWKERNKERCREYVRNYRRKRRLTQYMEITPEISVDELGATGSAVAAAGLAEPLPMQPFHHHHDVQTDHKFLCVYQLGNDDGRQLASAPTGPVNSGYGFVMNHLTAPTGVDVGHQTQTDQLMMANSNYYVPHQGIKREPC